MHKQHIFFNSVTSSGGFKIQCITSVSSLKTNEKKHKRQSGRKRQVESDSWELTSSIFDASSQR